MRHTVPRAARLLFALVAASACRDTTAPPAPPPTDPAGAPRMDGAGAEAGAQARQERLARRLALTLATPAWHRALHTYLDASPHREGKVAFSWLAGVNHGELRAALAHAGGDGEAEVARDLQDGPALELYLPVASHRGAWRQGGEFLVATQTREGDPPVAFDSRGRRRVLDPSRPPAMPVLALVPAEQPFETAFPSTGLVCDDSDGCGGGGAGSTGVVQAPGLYMTYASLTSTFEGWLRGDPEFEVHILGVDSPTTLKSYQCAGEYAGGPYTYDQNDKTWRGSVLLFSQAQLDAYRSANPGEGVRVLLLEDDDGACVIRTQRDRLNDLFQALDAGYQAYTAGRDSVFTITPGKFFVYAKAIAKIYNAIASLFNTNDEIVGTAIQDVVAGITWPGANWIVKGENSVTNGGIRLEMR